MEFDKDVELLTETLRHAVTESYLTDIDDQRRAAVALNHVFFGDQDEPSSLP